MIIDELAEKGFRVTITPICNGGEWVWLGGVKIGNDLSKITWVKSDNSSGLAEYKTYEAAYNAVINYCNNREVSKKGSKRNKV